MREDLQNEFVKKMQLCVDNCDTEDAHSEADDLLCELLERLGYTQLVQKYREVAKWYA